MISSESSVELFDQGQNQFTKFSCFASMIERESVEDWECQGTRNWGEHKLSFYILVQCPFIIWANLEIMKTNTYSSKNTKFEILFKGYYNQHWP